MEKVIDVRNLTKKFNNGAGIFDISFKIEKHSFCVLIGENGAGKSTLFKSIMGFLKPSAGEVFINGLESFKNQDTIKEDVSYIPGEFTFFDLPSGRDFLKICAELDEKMDLDLAYKIAMELSLDLSIRPKKMSKGTKQKLSIVNAFARNKEIYLLDEPFNGLDPLIREKFNTILHEAKNKSKTIFMSTNSIEEVANLCDRILIIDKGKILLDIDVNEIMKEKKKIFKVKFSNIENFSHEKFGKAIIHSNKLNLTNFYVIKENELNIFFKDLQHKGIANLSEHEFSLVDYVKLLTEKIYEKNNK